MIARPRFSFPSPQDDGAKISRLEKRIRQLERQSAKQERLIDLLHRIVCTLDIRLDDLDRGPNAKRAADRRRHARLQAKVRASR